MKTIHKIIADVEIKISAFLGFVALISIVVIFALEIKIATETHIRMVGADRNAFIQGLDEAIVFDDREGKDLILNWLKTRHLLLDAVVLPGQAECPFIEEPSQFFNICWSLNTYVMAYHNFTNNSHLAIKVPIKFAFDRAKLPVLLMIVAIFMSFAVAIRSIFRKLSQSIHEPIVALANAVFSGNPIPVTHEISELNTLADTLLRFREIERHRAISEVAQSLAHDIKNSLVIFESAATISSLEDLKSWQSEAQGALDRTWSIIDKFGLIDVDETLQIVESRLDIGLIAKEAQRHFPEVRIILESEGLSSDLFFKLDTMAINRVLINLIKNAVEADATEIQLKAKVEGSNLKVAVVDNGSGVPEPMLARLFKRGESYGKPRGQGIGLYNVKTIVSGHSGSVRYQRISELSVFELVLPGCVMAIENVDQNDQSSINLNEMPQQNTVLVAIKDRQRQQAILQCLAKYPVKILLERADSGFASVVLTEDHDLIAHYLAAGVPIVLENGKDDPEKIARQIVRRLKIQAETKGEGKKNL